MHQVFSELKSINLNTNEIANTSIIEDHSTNDDNSINYNSLSFSNYNSLQAEIDEFVNKYDKMQMNENLATEVDLDENEIIINSLLLIYDDSIQKGINEKDYILLIKQHIILKNKIENEIFNYLLDNKDKQQNIILLAKFYQHGMGVKKNEIKAFELYKEVAKKGHIDS